MCTRQPSAAAAALENTHSAGLVGAAYVVTKYVDVLPEGVRQKLAALLGQARGSAAGNVPLSKRIAYRVDTW